MKRTVKPKRPRGSVDLTSFNETLGPAIRESAEDAGLISPGGDIPPWNTQPGGKDYKPELPQVNYDIEGAAILANDRLSRIAKPTKN